MKEESHETDSKLTRPQSSKGLSSEGAVEEERQLPQKPGLKIVWNLFKAQSAPRAVVLQVLHRMCGFPHARIHQGYLMTQSRAYFWPLAPACSG